MAVLSIKRTENSSEAVPAFIFAFAVEADIEAEELVVAVSVEFLRVVSVDIRLLVPV